MGMQAGQSTRRLSRMLRPPAHRGHRPGSAGDRFKPRCASFRFDSRAVMKSQLGDPSRLTKTSTLLILGPPAHRHWPRPGLMHVPPRHLLERHCQFDLRFLSRKASNGWKTEPNRRQAAGSRPRSCYPALSTWQSGVRVESAGDVRNLGATAPDHCSTPLASIHSYSLSSSGVA